MRFREIFHVIYSGSSENPDFKTEFSFALDSLNYELELKKMGIWLQQVAKT